MDIERRKLAEDFEAMRSTLTTIVRTVAEKPGLEVTSEIDQFSRLDLLRRGQNPDEAWYFSPAQIDPRTGKQTKAHVRIPENIAEDGEIPAMGKAAHEGAHAASTRFEKISEAELPKEVGFQAVLHALEERPTDQLVRFRHPDYGECLDTARIGSYLEGMPDTGKSDDEDPPKRSGISKLSQLCNLFVYDRFADDRKTYDEEVLKLYEELRSSVEFIENCIPERGSTEEEIQKKQGIRFHVIKHKIWPKLQEVLKEDLSLQMLQALLQSILSGQIQIGSSAGSPHGAKPLCRIQLPPELAEQLSKLSGGAATTDALDIPIIKASPELIEALKKALDSIPEDVRKQLEDKAQKAMEKIEQIFVDEHAGKLVGRPPTPHERRQAIEENLKRARQEAEEQKIHDQIAAEQEKIRREQAALLENRTKYDQIYGQVRELEQAMYRELEEIFHPKTKAKVRLKASGARVNLGAYIKWETQRMVGKIKPIKFFESMERPQKRNFAFTLLVDLSGSMRGEKIAQTMNAIVAISEVFNRLGIHFEILGFQDQVIVFKKFSETLNETVRKKISGMDDEVFGKNSGGHNKPSYNDDGPCLLEAAKGLTSQSCQDKFLIVLSDGLPAGRRSTSADLETAVKSIRDQRRVHLIALGLGEDTEHVADYYPVSLPNIKAQELPDVLPELLEDIMLHPKKYLL